MENSLRTFISTKKSSNRSLIVRVRKSKTKLLDSPPEFIRKFNINQSEEFPLNYKRSKEKRDLMLSLKSLVLTSKRNRVYLISYTNTCLERKSLKTSWDSLKRKFNKMITKTKLKIKKRIERKTMNPKISKIPNKVKNKSINSYVFSFIIFMFLLNLFFI